VVFLDGPGAERTGLDVTGKPDGTGSGTKDSKPPGTTGAPGPGNSVREDTVQVPDLWIRRVVAVLPVKPVAVLLVFQDGLAVEWEHALADIGPEPSDRH